MKSYSAYTRVSSERQGERGVSLQEQESAIREFAAKSDLRISRWFEERVTAAAKGRPVFTHLVSLLKAGNAAGIVIHKIDRGARNLRDWADLGELIDQGIDVRFVQSGLDVQTRSGRLSADIQAVVDADYIRNLREETRKGFYGRLKQGLFPLPAPFGYVNNGGGNARVCRRSHNYENGQNPPPMVLQRTLTIRHRGTWSCGEVSLGSPTSSWASLWQQNLWVIESYR